MKNDGKSAEAGFLARKLAKPGVVVERFWDARDLRGRNGGRAVADFPKPSDFLVTEDGSIHYAEVKSTQNKNRFSFSQLEPAQRSACLRQAAVGGDYRIYVFSFELGAWFLLSATQFAAKVHDGQASITFEEMKPW